MVASHWMASRLRLAGQTQKESDGTDIGASVGMAPGVWSAESRRPVRGRVRRVAGQSGTEWADIKVTLGDRPGHSGECPETRDPGRQHAARLSQPIRVFEADDLTMLIGPDESATLLEIAVAHAEGIDFIVHAMAARPKFLE